MQILRSPAGVGGPEVGFGAWRASRKRESGGPEVQVGVVKTARVPRKWDGGPGNWERGGSRAGEGPEMETRSSSSDNSCGKRGSEEGEAGVALDRCKGFLIRGTVVGG